MDVIQKFWSCKLWLQSNRIDVPQLSYDCAKILDNLYIGSIYSAHSDSLRYHKFDAVINASCEIEATKTHTNYMKIEISDCEKEFIFSYFDVVNDFIKSKNRVLLHCGAGISRSATFVLAYLVGECKFPLIEAIKHVKSMRATICPNDGFLVQLILYEHYIEQYSTHSSIKISETLWRDTMSLLGLYKNVNNEDEEDVPREWKNLYKLGFSSSYKKS